MKIGFFTDASPEIGYGHLMRCRALADAINSFGGSCTMVGLSEAYRQSDDNKRFTDWIETNEWRGEEESARHLLKVLSEHSCDCVVLDDYRVDAVFQEVVYSAGVRFALFDHRIKRPIFADWTINASPGVVPAEYRSFLFAADPRLFVGTRFAILRSTFRDVAVRVHSKIHSPPIVLLSFGGGDDRGALQFVLDALYSALPNVEFIVISGRQNPRIEELNRQVCGMKLSRVSIYIEPDDIVDLFLKSSLAITAGGTMTFELARCGVPMVLLTVANNQIRQAEGWDASGNAIHLGSLYETSSEVLIDSVLQLLSDPDRLYRMRKIGVQLVDGHGADRVARGLVLGNGYDNNVAVQG